MCIKNNLKQNKNVHLAFAILGVLPSTYLQWIIVGYSGECFYIFGADVAYNVSP